MHKAVINCPEFQRFCVSSEKLQATVHACVSWKYVSGVIFLTFFILKRTPLKFRTCICRDIKYKKLHFLRAFPRALTPVQLTQWQSKKSAELNASISGRRYDFFLDYSTRRRLRWGEREKLNLSERRKLVYKISVIYGEYMTRYLRGWPISSLLVIYNWRSLQHDYLWDAFSILTPSCAIIKIKCRLTLVLHADS